MNKNLKNFLIFLALLASACIASVSARGVYQQPQEFLRDVFAGKPPQLEKLWIKKDLKDKVHRILGHDLGVLRIRYWGRDRRTAWILDEIGKEQPITAGIVVNEGKIESVKVLVFREARGWEVRYPFFTDQFKGLLLDEQDELNKNIDGISGATLSVNALTRLAQLALLLHRHSLFAANGDMIQQ